MKQSSNVVNIKYLRPKDQELRLEGLLLKEVFRKFLINKNVADRFVIDTHCFTRLPNKIGCFSSDGKWVVYETDDRSSVTDEMEHALPILAFQDTASRHGLNFKPTKSSRAQLEALYLDEAIKNTETVERNLRGTEMHAAVNDDVVFLRKQRRIANTLRQGAGRVELKTDNALPKSSAHVQARTKVSINSSSNKRVARQHFRMGEPSSKQVLMVKGLKPKILTQDAKAPLDSKKKIVWKEKKSKEG